MNQSIEEQQIALLNLIRKINLTEKWEQIDKSYLPKSHKIRVKTNLMHTFFQMLIYYKAIQLLNREKFMYITMYRLYTCEHAYPGEFVPVYFEKLFGRKELPDDMMKALTFGPSVIKWKASL